MFKNLKELFIARCREEPESATYRFLQDGREVSLKNAELRSRCERLARALLRRAQPADRAVILHPPGIDYVIAFFACVLAGIIAVPCYPPRFGRGSERLRSVIRAAAPALVIGSRDYVKELNVLAGEGAGIAVVYNDADAEAGLYESASDASAESVAFLQFTSGSTGAPKGVMVTHANLLNNLEIIRLRFENTRDSLGVVWLPPYHDMGLIGGILQPLFTGFPVVLMSPFVFLQKPVRWLAAISKYSATCSGGPNFAYQLCVDRITDADTAGLDLSSWKVAFNGAEPINPDVMRRFSEKFARCGFDASAFLPCYGLAEATLMVSGAKRSGRKREGRAASCGPAAPGHRVEIVDPESHVPQPEGAEGEIWVQGPSVAPGYWRDPCATRETFHAFLRDKRSEGTFLRTGDLGYLINGDLTVSGRIKDLIIIRGSNYYPQDVEEAVTGAHPDIAPGRAAAFGCRLDDEEKLIVIAEVARAHRRDADINAIRAAVVAAVTAKLGVPIHEFHVVAPGCIPITTSGKISRTQCRIDYLAGKFIPIKPREPQTV